jgi:hypothetical protein
MNTFKKLFVVTLLVGLGAVIATPASASNSIVAAALPPMSLATVRVGEWIASALQSSIAKVFSTPGARSAQAPSVTILDGNHMIVEARRLAPDSEPFRGLSGPRKKQAQY